MTTKIRKRVRDSSNVLHVNLPEAAHEHLTVPNERICNRIYSLQSHIFTWNASWITLLQCFMFLQYSYFNFSKLHRENQSDMSCQVRLVGHNLVLQAQYVLNRLYREMPKCFKHKALNSYDLISQMVFYRQNVFVVLFPWVYLCDVHTLL